MKELEIEIFTLPNCPACKRLKSSLEDAEITYTNKDTKEYADEWTSVQQITKTYYLPTIKMGDLYFAPNRDFKNDPEAIELINKALAGEIVLHQMDEIEMRETMKTLIFQLEMINVDHPTHYNQGKIEVIDAIEDWGLGFNDGNVVKYVSRSRHKGKPLEDLKKAKWYLEREIKRIEKESK